MQYKRVFKLKPYWGTFLKGIREQRQELNGSDLDSNENRKRPSCYYTWDNQNWIFGSHSCVINPDQVSLFIDEDLENIYHRKKLALKIFYWNRYPLFVDLRDCDLGEGLKAVETTIIQNILAFENFAPRVYDLVFLTDGEYNYLTQITEFIEKPFSEFPYDTIVHDDPWWEKVHEYCRKYFLVPYDLDERNVRNKKITDFENYIFRGDFKTQLISTIKQGLSFGGDTDILYQSIYELGIPGRRNNLSRLPFLSFNNLPPNFTTLDIGCNGGFFLRRAADYGSTRLVGTDLPVVIEASRFLNTYLGYFNIDFTSENIPQKEFDLVFFMSMINYLSNPEPIFAKTKHLLYFEGHGGSKAKDYLPLLEKYFKKIEELGYVDDYPEGGPRVVLRCWK